MVRWLVRLSKNFEEGISSNLPPSLVKGCDRSIERSVVISSDGGLILTKLLLPLLRSSDSLNLVTLKLNLSTSFDTL